VRFNMTTATHPSSGRLYLVAFLLLAGVSWGAATPFTKLAAEGGQSPLTLLFWQSLIMVVLLGARQVVMRQPLPLGRQHLAFYIIAGFLGSAFPNALSYWAAPHVPASVIVIIYAMIPLFTFALAVAVRQDRVEPKRLAGVALGFLAICVMTLPEAALPATVAIVWVGAVVVVAFTYATETVYAARFMPEDVHPLTLLLGMAAASLLLIAPVLVGAQIPLTYFQTGSVHEWALVGATVLHLIAYATFLHLIREGGPIFASQVSYPVAISGVLWGMWLFAERPSPWVWAALGLALAGLALVKPKEAG
jgi:drug/metabolite transporter (DMT)-like permease